MWFWGANQVIYGLLSAALFAVPLGLLFRNGRLRYGLLFVGVFVVSLVGGTVLVGAAENLPLLFSLPDTWYVIGGAVFFSGCSIGGKFMALPSNAAIERDAMPSRLALAGAARLKG
jgi:hypothetical protein